MKKGQRVRVLSTNELGTIKDHVLMKKGGRIGKYCQVKLDKHPEQDSWFMDDQLGSVRETVNGSFQDDSGYKINMQFILDHDKGGMNVSIEHLKRLDFKYLSKSFLGAIVANFMGAQGEITEIRTIPRKKAS